MNVDGRNRIFRFSTATAYNWPPFSAFNICFGIQCLVVIVRAIDDNVLKEREARQQLSDISFDRQKAETSTTYLYTNELNNKNDVYTTRGSQMMFMICVIVDTEKRD